MVTRVFEKYLENLKMRFFKSPDYISEDSIRYDFFAAMSETDDLSPSEFQLEYPLIKYLPDTQPQNKIDCVIPTQKMICEFKCWKKPKQVNAQSMLEGELFKDLYRLKAIKEFDYKFVIIVLHTDMYNHLNGFYGLFNNTKNIEISKIQIERRGKTFHKATKTQNYTSLTLNRVFLERISDGFWVSVFKVC